jgi:hypothetical protein
LPLFFGMFPLPNLLPSPRHNQVQQGTDKFIRNRDAELLQHCAHWPDDGGRAL